MAPKESIIHLKIRYKDRQAICLQTCMLLMHNVTCVAKGVTTCIIYDAIFLLYCDVLEAISKQAPLCPSMCLHGNSQIKNI